MIKGAVIGFPISHSLSPQIFSYLSKNLGQGNFNYEAIEVKPEKLSTFLSEAKSKYIGLNVTIPHKENILHELDELSPEAQVIGAVNCVHLRKDQAGKIFASGHNTDVTGFTESLIENKVNMRGKGAVILGAGGAARAVAYALGASKSSEVHILSKTKSRSEKIAADFKSQFPETQFHGVSLDDFQKKDLTLIVNATPLGMDGYSHLDEAKVFFTRVFKKISSENAAAFDLVYRPIETSFLKMAEIKGFSKIGGLEMLIYQALKSWEIWFGPLQNKIEIKKDLLVELGKGERIFITGFMGVGKSTVAKLVAEKLGWTLVDIDRSIEEKTGKTVGEFFKTEGEAPFRDLESKVIQEASKLPRVIVALGGGALLDSRNLQIVKKRGLLIYLSAKEENLMKRLKNSAACRPLLSHDQGLTLVEHIGNLMKAREAQYKEAHFEISTDQKTEVDVANKLIELSRAEVK